MEEYLIFRKFNKIAQIMYRDLTIPNETI